MGGKRERRTDEKDSQIFCTKSHKKTAKIEPTHTHIKHKQNEQKAKQKKRSCSCFHPSLRQEKRDEEYDDDDDDVEHAAQHSRG